MLEVDSGQVLRWTLLDVKHCPDVTSGVYNVSVTGLPGRG